MDSTKSPIKKVSTKGDVDPNEIKGIQQFVLGEKLGQGTFGKVRLATHVITGEKVAIKILEKDKIFQQEDKDRVEKEIKILKMIRHNNLIQLYQVIQTPKLIYLVMEFSPGKDLFTYIVNNKKIKEDEACFFFQQIIEGVDYCQKLRICHRDLKPENLLLEGKTLKLIDFGLSNIANKQGKLKTACGSPSYAAPEMISGEPEYYGSRVDIWSCGVILYVMVCGFLPFEDSNNEKLYKKIVDGKYALPSFVSEPCKDLIRKIMNIDQEKRFSIAEIKAHPWYKCVMPKINEGLLITQVVFPMDESVLKELEQKKLNTDEIRESIILNKNNHYTTSYYLLVKSRIRQGIQSESDLFSDAYIKYVKDPSNQLSIYNNDVKIALDIRIKEVKARREAEIQKRLEDEANGLNTITQGGNSFFDDNMAEDDRRDEKQERISRSERKRSTKGMKFDGLLVNNPFENSTQARAKTRDSFPANTTSTPDTTNANQSNTFVIVPKSNRAYHTISSTPTKSYTTLIRINKMKQIKSKAKTRSNLCSFDCSEISTLRETRNDKIDKYEELKKRVRKMKENMKYGIRFENFDTQASEKANKENRHSTTNKANKYIPIFQNKEVKQVSQAAKLM